MPNNEYINKITACNEINRFTGYLDDDMICRLQIALHRIPAADVIPARYAEWISSDGISVCSKCGKAAPYDVEGDVIMYWPNLNFCPNCGCKMNKEEENGI